MARSWARKEGPGEASGPEERPSYGAIPDLWERLGEAEREAAKRECRDWQNNRVLTEWYREHCRALEREHRQKEAARAAEREAWAREQDRLRYAPEERQKRREAALAITRLNARMQREIREAEAEERARLEARRAEIAGRYRPEREKLEAR